MAITLDHNYRHGLETLANQPRHIWMVFLVGFILISNEFLVGLHEIHFIMSDDCIPKLKSIANTGQGLHQHRIMQWLGCSDGSGFDPGRRTSWLNCSLLLYIRIHRTFV